MPSVETHIALLRGVNLGGKNKLPMHELVAILEEHGATDVRTYIQSGNAVYRAAPKLAARLPALVAASIEARLGFRAPVVARTRAELLAAIEASPFLAQGKEPKTLHLAFLADRPSPAQLAALDPARSPGDAFIVKERDIHLHLPNGVGRTKLTNAYFDAKLGTVSTVRNWRTVLALAELASV
jgi:uncharacterized protein (DUF1697 family)